MGSVPKDKDMAVFVKLDETVITLFCCPLCKGQVVVRTEWVLCSGCGSRFPKVSIAGGETFDFRLRRTQGWSPPGWQAWSDIQRKYEEWSLDEAARANVVYYEYEIDSVREVYGVFKLGGRILDVGGHQGRLRYFLQGDKVPLYVVVDPYADVWQCIEASPDVLKAYPCLCEPVNFAPAHGEYLPFQAAAFNWVHLRSVLDHLADPWLALKEAWRVLKPGGSVLVGTTIEDRISSVGLGERVRRKLQKEGLGGVATALWRRVTGVGGHGAEHTWRITEKALEHLLEDCGFTVLQTHWQKPPYEYVLYVQALKGTGAR